MATVFVRVFHRLSGYGWFASIAARTAPRADLWLHRRTHGRRTFVSMLVPVTVVTTIGRKSGRPRPRPLLVLDDPQGGGHIVVGSNFGLPDDPGWVLNLLADPRATIERDGVPVEVVARLLDGPARTRAWKRLVEVWPPYAAYAQRTARTFPVFRLEAAAAA